MAKTPEEALKWELHISFSRGMFDGAGRRPMRREYDAQAGARRDLAATYGRAYVLGQKLTRAAIEAHASEIGYVPNVLRAQDALDTAEIGKRYVLNALDLEDTPEDIERAARALSIGRAQLVTEETLGPPYDTSAIEEPCCYACWWRAAQCRL